MFSAVIFFLTCAVRIILRRLGRHDQNECVHGRRWEQRGSAPLGWNDISFGMRRVESQPSQ